MDNERMRRVDAPRYFHLLWEDDLEDLKPVLTAVRDRRSEVVTKWYSLYLLHFGDDRVLSEEEFFKIFEPALLRNKNSLLRKDMDGYAQDILRMGEALAERRVPLQEIIASLHLFEEAAQTVFPSDPPIDAATYAKFDKLSHIRIILLVDAYVRSQVALAATRIRALEIEAQYLPAAERTRYHGLVGKSEVMRKLFERIESAGQTRGTILIKGESGSGKELVAQAIKECGPDAKAGFVSLNCAALPKDLIESELFGYMRGAFSGANADYLGLFRAAEGGTLFLDEVTEMNVNTQSKLLRAIQERTVRPVGSTKELPVNVRIIASTNRDPREAVRKGQFREDLFYRLQAGEIDVPPLRDRLDDVPLLANYFVDLFNERKVRATPVLGVDNDAVEVMKRYKWPGNVRELANAIESAFTFGKAPTVRLSELPRDIGGNGAAAAEAPPPISPHVLTFGDAERDLIERALKMSKGNKKHVAEILKISRKKLYAKIAKYGLGEIDFEKSEGKAQDRRVSE
ncbi:MAG TPA: sigma-54 dependent transcriptional regulator [Candidatus Binataceae bacterium]|nr:sigma-54 dependent transcriptional regulator [Candidatus Binataceae bacterium]